MRRIDAIALALGFFLFGGVVYAVLLAVGLESQKAGIYTQACLMVCLVIWLLSYVFRVVSHDMTYHHQIKDYEEAMIQKRWESLSEEERQKLQAEVEREKLAALAKSDSEV